MEKNEDTIPRVYSIFLLASSSISNIVDGRQWSLGWVNSKGWVGSSPPGALIIWWNHYISKYYIYFSGHIYFSEQTQLQAISSPWKT